MWRTALLLITLIIAVGGVVALAVCKNAERRSAALTAPVAAEPASDDVPLSAEQAMVDHGTVFKPTLESRFVLKNKHQLPIRIQKIGKSCSCMDVEIPSSVVAPGTQGEIVVRSRISAKDPGTVVNFQDSLTVHHDASPIPLVLTVRGKLIPPAYCHSRRINVPAPETVGEPFEGEIELFLNEAQRVLINKVTVSEVSFHARVDTGRDVPADGYRRAVLRISGKRPGGPLPQSATVTIHTTSKDQPTLDLELTLQPVAGKSIELTPDKIALGVINAGEEASGRLLIRLPTGEKYDVVSVSSERHFMSCSAGEVKRNAAGDVVLITVRERLSEPAPISARVIVRLRGVSGERTVEFPVTGFVRAGTDSSSAKGAQP